MGKHGKLVCGLVVGNTLTHRPTNHARTLVQSYNHTDTPRWPTPAKWVVVAWSSSVGRSVGGNLVSAESQPKTLTYSKIRQREGACVGWWWSCMQYSNNACGPCSSDERVKPPCTHMHQHCCMFEFNILDRVCVHSCVQLACCLHHHHHDDASSMNTLTHTQPRIRTECHPFGEHAPGIESCLLLPEAAAPGLVWIYHRLSFIVNCRWRLLVAMAPWMRRMEGPTPTCPPTTPPTLLHACTAVLDRTGSALCAQTARRQWRQPEEPIRTGSQNI